MVPDVTLTVGAGDAFGSLKKKFPTMSPQLSEIRSQEVTVAVAPLLCPTMVAPLTQYPKYIGSFANDLTPQLNNLDVAEYVSDGAGRSLSYGSTLYFSTRTDGDPNPAPISGRELSPNL